MPEQCSKYIIRRGLTKTTFDISKQISRESKSGFGGDFITSDKIKYANLSYNVYVPQWPAFMSNYYIK